MRFNWRCLTHLPGPGLLLLTFRLAWRAQRVKRQALPETIGDLMALGLPGRARILASRCTVRLVSRLFEAVGLLGNCLVQSLVLGVLLSDRPGVELRIGFRPGGADDHHPVAGHAWVVLDGQNILDNVDTNDTPYADCHSIVLRRPESK